jgi:hypothetical protein
MVGDDRRRFCAECGRDVHAVAAYSEAEWAALLAKGRVCAYSEGESSRRAVIAGVLLTTISPMLAQAGVLRVVVVDSSGAPVGKSSVTVVGTDGTVRNLEADSSGVVEFVGLPTGSCEVKVEGLGFQVWRAKLAVSTGMVDARLEVSEPLIGVYVTAVPAPPPTGSLRVEVTDGTEYGLAGAEVSLVAADGKTRSVRTDSRGVATLGNLPLGHCEVTVWRTGFQRWSGSRTVQNGQVLVAVRLEVGAVGEFVDIPMIPMVKAAPAGSQMPPKTRRFRWWGKG